MLYIYNYDQQYYDLRNLELIVSHINKKGNVPNK